MRDRKIYIASVKNKKNGSRSVQKGEYFSKKEMAFELRANEFKVHKIWSQEQYRKEVLKMTDEEFSFFEELNMSYVTKRFIDTIKDKHTNKINKHVLTVVDRDNGVYDILLSDYTEIRVFVEEHYYCGEITLKNHRGEITFNEVRAFSENEAVDLILEEQGYSRSDILVFSVYKELEQMDLLKISSKLSKKGLLSRQDINNVLKMFNFLVNDTSCEDIINDGGMYFTHIDDSQVFIALEICDEEAFKLCGYEFLAVFLDIVKVW